MARRSRKKKISRRRKSPTTVLPSEKTAEGIALPPDAAKLQPDSTVLISNEIFVAAPAESCFGVLASQLERVPQWNPTVIDVKPVSSVRRRIGATSQVSFNLGGKKLESLTMISRYYPNRAISWVATRKPKVREDWRLGQKPHGTLVGVTMACEVGGWVIGRLLHKITRQKKIERDLDKMLTQLKALVEGVNRNQMVGG